MARKSFQTYTPTTGQEFDINGEVFHLRPSVPGDLLLDFLGGLDDAKPSAMASVVRNLIDAALVDEDKERWVAFIREPANGVSMEVLAEVAGFIAETLSGKGQQPSLAPFGAG